MVLSRLSARFKYLLERALQRGIWSQVLVMALLIVLVAVLGGMVVWVFGDEFETAGAAIWWSFLRLTDPGYLGDDEGALMRTVSTVVTVLGYVLFMGSLIAIMTQWLARTMRALEGGTTPIAINGHILILGWTNRTPEIVEQIISSRGRLKRFLRQRGRKRLRIVILAEAVNMELTQELRGRIGSGPADDYVIFRSGSSLKLEHLRRVDLGHASAVIVPGADFEKGGWELSDTRTIKTLMSIANFERQDDADLAPSVVAELFDSAKIPIACSIMDSALEIVASGSVTGGMIAQTIRNPGLSRVYDHLFSRSVPESLYLRACPEATGAALLDLLPAFSDAIPIGVVRTRGNALETCLNEPGMVVEEGDLLVFVTGGYDACRMDDAPAPPPATGTGRSAGPDAQRHRILVLGWSHKLFSLLGEFNGYGAERFEIDNVSRVSESGRLRALSEVDYDEARIKVTHLVGDYTLVATMKKLDLARYDSIVFMASDNMDTAEQADARTVLGFALVKDRLRTLARSPQLLLELMDGENAHLFEGEQAETIISPRVLSHLLAQIAMRRELSGVYESLFGPHSADIVFREAAGWGIDGAMTFSAMAQLGAARGEILLGVARNSLSAEAEIILNPDRGMSFEAGKADRLIVLKPPARDR